MGLRPVLTAVVLAAAMRAPVHGASMVCPLGERGCGPVVNFPDADPTRATLLWWTDVDGDSVVDFGMSPALGSCARVPRAASCPVGEPGTCHRVTLTGLTPGTRYFYRLESGSAVVQDVDPTASFETLHAPGEASGAIDFVVVGDWGWVGDSDCLETPRLPKCRVAARIDALRPRPQLMITVGDNAYPSGLQTPDWDRNAMLTYRTTWRSLPVFFAFGNHDLRASAGNGDDRAFAASAEARTFAMPTNSPKPGLYYSFDSGDAHFLVANSNFAATSGQPEREELRWMDADLAATPRRWKFVFFHHTPYTCGTGGGDLSDRGLRGGFGPILERRGVDVVFHGHAHLYERSRLVDDYRANGAAGHDGMGTYYVTSGHGGGALDGPATIADGRHCPAVAEGRAVDGECHPCYWLATGCPGGPAGTSYCSFSRYGFTHVRITDDRTLRLEAIDDAGAVFDTWTVTKGSPPPNRPSGAAAADDDATVPHR